MLRRSCLSKLEASHQTQIQIAANVHFYRANTTVPSRTKTGNSTHSGKRLTKQERFCPPWGGKQHIMTSAIFGVVYCFAFAILLMWFQIEVHERAHLALSRGTLRRINRRQCISTAGFKDLSSLRQFAIYSAGITANALLGIACFVLSQLFIRPSFWYRWTAVALTFGVAESIGMVVANLLPLSTDGRMLAALLIALARRRPPNLDSVPQATDRQKVIASILGGCAGLLFSAWIVFH